MAKQATFMLIPYDAIEVKGKNTLVMEIVKHYVKCNPSVTAAGLKKMFNGMDLLRGGQVITMRAEAEKDTANIEDNGCNYFLKDPIKLSNGEEIIVWCYWPDKFFQPFCEMVRRDLGYVMEEVTEDEE